MYIGFHDNLPSCSEVESTTTGPGAGGGLMPLRIEISEKCRSSDALASDAFRPTTSFWPSCSVLLVMAVNTGGTLVALTVMVNEALAVSVPSLAVSVTPG